METADRKTEEGSVSEPFQNEKSLGVVMKVTCWLVFLMLCLCPSAGAQLVLGSIVDAASGRPLAGVDIRSFDDHVASAEDGRFALTTEESELIVRLPGYRAQRLSVSSAREIALQPVIPRALYLSFWAADLPAKRERILQLIDELGLNALVIDVKTSRGHIAYRSTIPLASEIGAQQVRPLKDLPEFLEDLKARGIYTIARMVVFKDDLLAKQRPQYAVHAAEAQLWEDREGLSWADPFNLQVQEYNLAVAEEVARLGFDEIQLDYIRFPSRSDLIFSQSLSDEARVTAINAFLDRARQRLAGYPTYLSANIFGYICWKHRDGKIGQRLVDLAERVDYLAPMLYPSGFERGIPGYANPVEYPYQIIANSLQSAQQLSGLAPERFRPWLQAFRDYGFDRRRFLGDEVQAQINASEAMGSHGWMLWNAASRFSLAGLSQSLPDVEKKLVDVEPKASEMAIVSQVNREEETLPFAVIRDRYF